MWGEVGVVTLWEHCVVHWGECVVTVRCIAPLPWVVVCVLLCLAAVVRGASSKQRGRGRGGLAP